jgi:broad specificity phosphatase PhoE
MKFYICRHADKESVHQYSKLSEKGREQAQHLAQHLASRLDHPPFILSSPYHRCIATASAIAKECGDAPILIERGLSEGPLPHGETRLPVALHALKAAFMHVDTAYVSYYSMPSKENTQRDVLVRCIYMCRHLLHEFVQNNNRRDVIIVTHGTVAMGLVAAMLATPTNNVCARVRAVEGCTAAGYYTVEHTGVSGSEALVYSDSRCRNAFLPVQSTASTTTPVCTFEM